MDLVWLCGGGCRVESFKYGYDIVPLCALYDIYIRRELERGEDENKNKASAT